MSHSHPCFVPFDIKSKGLTSDIVISSFIPPSMSEETDESKIYSGSINDAQKSISLFILKMQEELLLPNSTVSSLVEGMNELARTSAILMKDKIIKMLEKKK